MKLTIKEYITAHNVLSNVLLYEIDVKTIKEAKVYAETHRHFHSILVIDGNSKLISYKDDEGWHDGSR